MFIYGIDTDSRCNYRSNENFVHFIWDHFERFSIRKLAITLLPTPSATTPLHLFDTLLENTRLLYLRYYRAASDDWWKDRKNCDQCIYINRLTLMALSTCRQSENNRSSIICKRQPPSLRDLSSDAYFRDIRHFDFNVNTTFSQYVNAVDSDLVYTAQPVLQVDRPFKYVLNLTTFKINSILIVLGKGHGIVKFLVLTKF